MAEKTTFLIKLALTKPFYRMTAYFVDALIIAFISFGIEYFTNIQVRLISYRMFHMEEWHLAFVLRAMRFWNPYYHWATILTWFCYKVICMYTLSATLGMLSAGIKIVDLHNRRPTFLAIVFRILLEMLSRLFLHIPLLWRLKRMEYQYFHDYLSSTVMVFDKPSEELTYEEDVAKHPKP